MMRVTSVEELTVPIANVTSNPGQGAPEVSVAVAVMSNVSLQVFRSRTFGPRPMLESVQVAVCSASV